VSRQYDARCRPEQNKGKQREELADTGTLPPDDVSATADFDTNGNRTFWKFLRARGKNTTTSPAQMTHDLSPKAVEVYAVRGAPGNLQLHCVYILVLRRDGNDRDMWHGSRNVRQSHRF